ncbi:MAG TPA: hypothetical protein VLE69_00490 [Candidatus Saccharimonadales bacterium]|nr:hypothetical protein [Candidatus Saccharimonadales bacterium]
MINPLATSSGRKKLLIASLLVIIGGRFIDLAIIFPIYGCVGNNSTTGACSASTLHIDQIITRVILLATYVAAAVLFAVLVAWLIEKSKKKS